MSEPQDRLHSLTSDQFEAYLADLWEQQGYVTEQTQGSHDYGVDVFAHPQDREQLEVIQAKRNKPGNTVGGPTVQRTIGAREQHNATKAVVATTSSFTSNAKTVAQQAEVELIDGTDLAKLDQRLNTDTRETASTEKARRERAIRRVATG
jgi:restriction endonuclease Mrr